MQRRTLPGSGVAGAAAPAVADGGATVLLSTAPGRLALRGLSPPRDELPVAAMRQALQTMRRSMARLQFAVGTTEVFPSHEMASARTNRTEALEGIVRLPVQPHPTHCDVALQPTIA